MSLHTLALFLACATFVLPGCNRQAAEQMELLPGVRSHTSSKEVRGQIAKVSDSWRVMEDTKTAVNDKRPPFHVLTVAIDSYSDLDEPGSLHIQFFNDRLMSARFFPKDVAKYLAKLKERRGIVVSLSQGARTLGISVQYSVDYRGQSYVAYVDEGLQQELDSWIKRYSQISKGADAV
jgi:hypothetical protein